MAGSAEGAEGTEELRGEKEDESGSLEADAAVQQASAKSDGDEANSRGDEEFESEAGEKGNLENTKGGIAIAVAEALDAGTFGRDAIEHDESGKPLNGVEKTSTEAGKSLPLAFGTASSVAANKYHKDRENRKHNEEKEGTEPVFPGNGKEDDGGDDSSEATLWEIATEVGVEALNAVDGKSDKVTGVLSETVAGADGSKGIEDLEANCAASMATRDLVESTEEGLKDGTEEDGSQQGEKRAGECGKRSTMKVDSAEDEGKKIGLEDSTGGLSGAESRGEDKAAAQIWHNA